MYVQVLGAGDVLVAPLGAALTALGLLIYKHWKALALPGIAATAVVSAAFSVATSVLAAKLLGVSTGEGLGEQGPDGAGRGENCHCHFHC
jgi:putative effector of murein hydrolase